MHSQPAWLPVQKCGMLRSNCKLWYLSPTLEVWDKALGFPATTADVLAFVVWFAQGYYQFICWSIS